ncbi:MAG: vitamin K epoxide reductase family protein [Gemmatimonadota bacterium]
MRPSSLLRRAPLVMFLAAVLAAGGSASGQQAPEPVVRAVLFFSPTCPHCHYVINEVLPPLTERYGSGFRVVGVDVTTPSGQSLYQATVSRFRIPDDRLGVPTMVVGSDVLVGDQEIPDRLPGLIEQGLAAGGVDWPDVPALRAALSAPEPEPSVSTEVSGAAVEGTAWQRFAMDPVGNGIAVAVLALLLVALGAGVAGVLAGRTVFPALPAWTVPLLATAGMAVASYLAVTHVTGSAVVCGPVGDCNAVQQSSWATLFGVLPVGILGQLGYLAVFGGWMLAVLGPDGVRRPAWAVVWSLAVLGTAFSAWLTYLEPFVIGASCAWCLTSAVIMALLLVASTPRVATRPTATR